MPQWVTVVLPIATLLLGACLTMANQSLSDRRQSTRERQARREEFRNVNFEIHRTAMLEMQEVVHDSAQAVAAEQTRRKQEGDYEYYDSKPFKGLDSEGQLAAVEHVNDALARLKQDDITEAKRQEINDEMLKIVERASEKARSTHAAFEVLVGRMENNFPFWETFTQFIYRLRLCMYRSGSNSVIECGERYIQAVFKWSNQLRSEESSKSYIEVRNCHIELDRALSNALTNGPYDTYSRDAL